MIFGIQNPKIIDSGANTILLDNVVVLVDEPITYKLIHQSPLNGNRNVVHRGKRWTYEIRYHLFKQSTDHATIFETLYDLLGTEVTLYRHRDKNPFQDTTGTVVPFIFKEINPVYVETVNYRDALILKFISTKFVDLTKNLS
jgi:hypothetical protein